MSVYVQSAPPEFTGDERRGSASNFSGRTMSYEDELRSMYYSKSVDFKQNVLPMIDVLENEATSQDTVNNAKKRALMLEGQATDVSERQKQYSQSTMLPSMSNALTKRIQRNTTLMNDSTVSMANDAQVDKRRAARQSLTSIAENLQSTGIAGMAQVSANKAQRDAAYKQQKKGAMAQTGAILGGIAGAFVGGPAGASAGASIGGSIGGSFG